MNATQTLEALRTLVGTLGTVTLRGTLTVIDLGSAASFDDEDRIWAGAKALLGNQEFSVQCDR